MEKVLHSLVGKVSLVYLDDVLVLGKNLEEHLEICEKFGTDYVRLDCV